MFNDRFSSAFAEEIRILFREYFPDFRESTDLPGIHEHHFDGGRDRIAWGITDRDKQARTYTFSFIIQKRIDAVEEPWDRHKHRVGLGNQPPAVTMAFNTWSKKYPAFRPDHLPLTERCADVVIKNAETRAEVLSRFRSELELVVLPWLDLLNDLPLLDRWANDPPEKYQELRGFFASTGLMLRKLILARRAGNPRYPDVVAAMESFLDDTWGKAGDAEEEYRAYQAIFDAVRRELES